MKPAPFDYHRPETLEEALGLLSELGTDARPLAGGQSLIPFMNFRLARPAALVDLNRVDGLTEISQSGDVLTVGAMARQWDVEHSPVVGRVCPMIPAALGWVGHTATRTRGTIGGSLAHADPAAELGTVAVSLGAEMTVATGGGSTRTLSASEFFLGHYTTALAHDEILTEVRFPTMPDSTSWSFREFSFRSGDFAIASAAVTLTGHTGEIDSANVTLGGVGATPVGAREAGNVLERAEPSDRLWQEAGEAAAAEIEPIDDQVPSGYRRQIVAYLVEDAARRAWESNGGHSG
ncbi:MAG: xanthine dehydrogenase family protein subunit M [Acidimicrobiia bacterium]|jgi:carbon-monoxide dehydrogenase medium subunit